MSEILHAVITRILNDKIILGLIIVAVLGVFVGGFVSTDEKGKKAHADSSMTAASDQADGGKPLDPALATDFVKWWISMSMDYSAQTAQKNHTAAFGWMTPAAAKSFQTILWTPEIASDVAQGHLIAAFQPISVQAEAVNPDGSVVVLMNGTFVTQVESRQPHPSTQQMQTELLVKKETEGLRIAGIYNRVATLPGPLVY